MLPEKETVKAADHSGHRQRMRTALLKNGASGMNDAQLLEILLFYAVPRVDTRVTAEKLIERFGSLEGVLSADISVVREFSGLKDNVEALFVLLRELMSRARAEGEAPELADREAIKKYLVRLYRGADSEIVYALYYDTAGAFVGKQMVHSGDVNSARFSLRAVTEGVIRAGGKSVILAHNHPSGSIVPSNDDILSTKRISAHLSANEIDLVEHYIVAGEGCTGILKPDWK